MVNLLSSLFLSYNRPLQAQGSMLGPFIYLWGTAENKHVAAFVTQTIIYESGVLCLLSELQVLKHLQPNLLL